MLLIRIAKLTPYCAVFLVVCCLLCVMCRDVPVAFIDSGLASLQKLIQVERMVMDRLFWPSDPVIQVRPAACGGTAIG